SVSPAVHNGKDDARSRRNHRSFRASPVPLSQCSPGYAATVSAALAGRHDGPVVSRGQPSQMAPGPYQLVLRDLCAERIRRRVQALPPGLSLALQQLLQLTGRDAGKEATRLLLPATARR